MVQISSKGYNVAKIGINGILEQDTDTIIGTAVDFDTIARFAKTGYMVLRCKYKEGAETLMFDGSVDCEINEDGSIFISTLTDNGAENDEDKKFYAITGVIYKSEGKCYMNLSEDEISGSGGGTGGDEYVEVTGDGAKTYKVLLTELYALVDTTKLRPCKSFIVLESKYYLLLTNVYSPTFYFNSLVGSNIARTCSIDSRPAYVKYTRFSASTSSSPGGETDMSSNMPDNGSKITLYY